ncbi:hypothetical protein [Geobacter sp. FeAm09]|uniref:hypothetical protein n=1 Tax=Geobacter sp. FeAm09 TaxID=2597769 RepID=UPI00143D87B8|nr:hypothetical protein [Geobacter sp. FeAm09]
MSTEFREDSPARGTATKAVVFEILAIYSLTAGSIHISFYEVDRIVPVWTVPRHIAAS